jgi:hypothetical protein
LGHVSDYRLPGTGRFEGPSISAYPLIDFRSHGQGNTKPLRVIRGPKTGGFGGGQVTVYAEKELILTNSMDGWAVWSIYDNGDVAPGGELR